MIKLYHEGYENETIFTKKATKGYPFFLAPLFVNFFNLSFWNDNL